MAASKRRLSSGRERGSVIVEMAIVTPLLMLIIAGVVDLGLLFWEKEVLTNAAREGARAAAKAKVAGAANLTTGAVRAIVQNYLTNNEVKDASGGPLTLTSANCTYTWDTATTPATVMVQLVDIPVKMMMIPNIQTLFGGSGITSVVKLNARITMAAEWTTPPSP